MYNCQELASIIERVTPDDVLAVFGRSDLSEQEQKWALRLLARGAVAAVRLVRKQFVAQFDEPPPASLGKRDGRARAFLMKSVSVRNAYMRRAYAVGAGA